MTTRLVCRSAPLPTKHIAREMGLDHLRTKWIDFHRCDEGCEWCDPDASIDMTNAPRANRMALASPEATDNGQCWSEEVFSMLEGER